MTVDFPLSDSWFDDEVLADSVLDECNRSPTINVELDMKVLQQPIDFFMEPRDETNRHLRRLLHIVTQRMGSMTLCRGVNGDRLREAGAIHAVMSMLYHLISPLSEQFKSPLHDSEIIIDLATTALGALRDLACGNASNRCAIGSFYYAPPQSTSLPLNGMQIIAWFIQRHHLVPWEHVTFFPQDSRSYSKELRMLTTAIAVIRNTTHSNRINCDILQSLGLTPLLIWRLVYGHTCADSQDITMQPMRSLPNVSIPWREACFRIASSLVNMAEHNVDCAIMCASNQCLVEILLTSWDDHLLTGDDGSYGKQMRRSIPLIHPGLMNILTRWQEINSTDSNCTLSHVIKGVLMREQERKVAARMRRTEEYGTHVIVKLPGQNR
jgi:hypothetical protein